jgi:redox-sensitive bicupin YhaK (pirin superfamily)
VGRHADSLGNRGTYSTPGMQWMSVGSGVEHAEAGGTPAGHNTTGFQLWVNVPSARKMEPPRYGTVPDHDMPVVRTQGVHARILAGQVGDHVGPFVSVQPLQIVDFELAAAVEYLHANVPVALNNCLLYCYAGAGAVNGVPLNAHDAVRLDATQAASRDVVLQAGADGMKVMLFAGTRLDQPVAWRGPIVMTTEAEIHETLADIRRGAFPPVRVPWDYKQLSKFPLDGDLINR